MKPAHELVDEIVNGAVESEISVSTLLRKCRIVSESYQNDELTEWVQKELNGYDDRENLPSYREISAGAKGFMLGAFGSHIDAQPLASAVMEEEHRHFAEKVFLCDPVSSYENLKEDGDGGYRVEWSANLVVKYQSSFINGYALNRAWQDVPVHAMRAVAETVRNRVLEFALSMRREFGPSLDASNEKVNAHISSVVQSILQAE